MYGREAAIVVVFVNLLNKYTVTFVTVLSTSVFALLPMPFLSKLFVSNHF